MTFLKMKAKSFLIIILVFVLGGSALAIFLKSDQNEKMASSQEETGFWENQEKAKLTVENVEFEVEIAQSPAARTKGLGGRSDLCPQCGMLFIFETDNYHAFWMKDTLIPLDIIWLDKNWQVVDFTAFAQPQAGRPDEELPVYRPKTSARYVLELPGGTVEKIRGFKIGSRVELEK